VSTELEHTPGGPLPMIGTLPAAAATGNASNAT